MCDKEPRAGKIMLWICSTWLINSINTVSEFTSNSTVSMHDKALQNASTSANWVNFVNAKKRICEGRISNGSKSDNTRWYKREVWVSNSFNLLIGKSTKLETSSFLVWLRSITDQIESIVFHVGPSSIDSLTGKDH